jgi:hypothetical protein
VEFRTTHVTFGNGWRELPDCTDSESNTLTLTLPAPPEGASGWIVYHGNSWERPEEARRKNRALRKALPRDKKRARARTGRR